MKVKVFFLSIFISSIISVAAQTKHAFVIAISDYPQIPGRENWTKLSSKNDYDLVMEMLKRQEFQQSNIISLLDKEATVENIENAFEKLIATSNSGDIVYFHFSGHGQQVADVKPTKNFKSKFLKPDERDGYDEALVTYNAPLKFENDYQYQDHFVDDQMNYYMNRLRKKIGGNGQVIAVFDCCHSGSATRGEQTMVVRGSNIICAPTDYRPETTSEKDSSLAFDADFDYSNSSDMGKLTAFFGCKSDQVDREIKDEKTNKGYGSLTYYFIKAMEELGPNSSYNNLFSKINEQMVLGFQNQQQPEVEGDNLNQLIFKGTFIDQKPYYQITYASYKELNINGGSLQGLSVGDSVGIYSSTTLSTKGQTAKYNGIVTQVEPYSATINLNSAFESGKDAEVKYRAFVTYSSAPPMKLKLNINVSSKSLKKELEALFANEKAIELVKTDFEYQIVDSVYNGKSDNVVVFLGPNKQTALRGMSPRAIKGDPIQADSVLQIIKQSMKTDMFRKLEIEDEKLKLEYQILWCDAYGDCKFDSVQFMKGNLRFKDLTTFKISIKNAGKSAFYLNIIDIEPTNKLTWITKDRKKTIKNRYILPDSDAVDFTVSLGKPYGIEQMKLIATDMPVDFSALNENGSSLSRGGDVNPLVDFVDKSINGTRGVRMSGVSGATVKTLTFEIMKPNKTK